MCASASVIARHSARRCPTSLSRASVSSDTLSAWRTKKMVRTFCACAPGANVIATKRQIPAILANVPTKNLPLRFLFHARGPAHSKNDGRLVELALNRIDWAALVESEHLVAEVQARNNQLQPLIHPVTALDVVLRVCVEVDIASGPLHSKNGIHRLKRLSQQLPGGLSDSSQRSHAKAH